MSSRADAGAWARELGISREATQLYLDSEVIDLHLDSFIWHRIFGYDLTKRHDRAPLGGWFLGHADFPRVRSAGLAAATWVITTNPLREPNDRLDALLRNIAALTELVRTLPGELALTSTFRDYRAARQAGLHAVFVGIQGGNALEAPNAVAQLPRGSILRVTLVHLSSSSIGATSSPLRVGPDTGLGAFGKGLVQELEAARILVDLAHVGPQGFWDAVAVHDPSLPLVVTHTGVSGVHRHWRNLDDAQLRAIAESGGVVGVMFHSAFLGDRLWAGRAESVVDHLNHIVRVAGEDCAALGSDFDGAIVPPRDLTSVLQLPRLVEHMLRRGWSSDRIQKILGRNFLRVLAEVRP